MNIKKVCGFLGLAVLVAAFMALPQPAKAEMFVEAYIGGTTAANSTTDFNFGLPAAASTVGVSNPGVIDPSVIAGLKLGTWFVKEGFLGYDYPDWMKYLGFWIDFSYNRLDFAKKHGNAAIFNPVTGTGFSPTNFKSEGDAFTLAFMFAGRYGFFPDSEVPFGRLQPYLAVGPAILFSSQEPKITLNNAAFPLAVPLTTVNYGISPSSKTSVNICLATEAGVRYMCLKNVSLDVSFKYRYAQPHYKFGFIDPLSQTGNYNFDFSPTYHQFSGQLGVAYHF
jgi:hypothetical protein